MQNVIIDPLVIAPANAQTSTDAIGCVEPSTAPKRPATMAKAVTDRGKRSEIKNYSQMKGKIAQFSNFTCE